MDDEQKHLADLLFKTKTKAKVRRRKKNSDGSFDFYLIERDTSPIDFRVDPGEFVFKHHEQFPDAPLSPMYINLRNLPGSLNLEIGKAIARIPLDQTPEVCAGIPKAAIPYTKVFSEESGIPSIEIFAKEDGEAKRSIVPLPKAPKGEGRKLIIIDDLITRAASKLEAIKIAEDLGYKVLGVAVLVDREEGGREELESHGYKLYAYLKLSELLNYYLEENMITKEQYLEAQEYLNSSRNL